MNLIFQTVEPWRSFGQALINAGPQVLTAVALGAAILFALPILLYLRPSVSGRRRLLRGVGVALAILVIWVLVRSGDLYSSLSGRAAVVGMALFVVAPFVLAGLTIWSYLGTAGATPRRIAAVLALRLGAYLLVLLGIFRPALEFSEKDKKRTLLLFAVDASQSMTILDEFDNQSRWSYLLRNLKEAEPSIQKLRESGIDVSFYRFGGDVAEFSPDEPCRADSKSTDIGGMLATLYEGRDARPLLGLLILSDGADNGTRYPALSEAARWRRLPCPIHTFAYGKTTTRDVTKDVVVRDLVLPPGAVPIKSEVTLGVRVDAPGFKDMPVRIVVLFDDKEVKAQDAVLREEEGNLFAVKVNAPPRPGEVQVTVRLEDPQRPGQPLPGQVTRLKSEMSTFMTVTKEGISVLLVDKQRAWEPQLLSDALSRERRIRLYPVWLRGDEPTAAVQDLFNFEKQQYDVVILGDVTAAQLKAINPEALAQLEQQVDRGAGLLMIGGYACFGNSDWQGTPLERLLPIELNAMGQVEGAVRMVPTEAGLRRYRYVMGLADREQESKEIWAKLQPLEGATRLGTPKKNVASILAVTDRNDPLLVTRDYGGGRVLAFGGDTTYRWVRSPQGLAAHDRFWQRMVIWLARQEETESRAWVRPGTRRLPIHTDLSFLMGLRSKGGVDIKDGKYAVEVYSPDNLHVNVIPRKIGNEDGGLFTRADVPGVYRVVVKGEGKGPDGEDVKAEAMARFLVYDEEAELTRRAADHEFLKKLATAGGGQFLRADKLSEFLDRLQSQPRDPHQNRGEVWPNWESKDTSAFRIVYLLLFVGLIGGEWFVRRRWGWV
jgi:uncharacterized membrane protein